jgi:hypothetical protein
LPDDFNDWDLANKEGWTVAHAAASEGWLPKGFNQWELADCDGWTVAHEAATHGCLPKGFKQWSLATEGGWTVAHAAAGSPDTVIDDLFEDFNDWHLADENGWTVAHEMVRWSYPPPKNFNQWELKDKEGWTVAHEAARVYKKTGRGLQKDKLLKYLGITDLSVPKVLSKSFNKWEVTDNKGETVAHTFLTGNLIPDVYEFVNIFDR